METSQRANRIATLEQQLLDVERELIALHQGREPEATTPPRAAEFPPPPAATFVPPPPPPSGPPPAPPFGRPAERAPAPSSGPRPGIVEVLLRIGGIALVVLAIIFFVSTAISRGWIGPTAQLTLATTASVAIIAQSFRFGEDKRPWRVTFAAGGAAALFASGVIGHVGLDILSFPVAFGWLAASVVAFLGLSRLHDSELIAALSAPATIIGSLLLTVADDAELPLLALVGGAYVLAVAAVTWQQRWHIARALGVGAGAGISLLGLAGSVWDSADEGATVLALAVGVIAVLLIATMQSHEYARLESDGTEGIPVLAALEARFIALTVPWVAAVVAIVAGYLVEDDWDFGWTAAAVGLVSLVAVTLLSPKLSRTMVTLHQLASIATICVGASLAVDGPTLLLILLAQAVITVYLAETSGSVEMRVGAVLFVAILGLDMLGFQAIGALERGLTNAEIAATGLATAVVALGSWRYKDVVGESLLWIGGWLALLGWAASLRLAVSQGDMITTLLWAALGTAMILGGARHRHLEIVWGGLATLAVTAAKLVLVDLANVDVLWRAGLFFVVGTVFLRLGFMVPELLDRNGSSDEDDPADRHGAGLLS